MLQANKKDSFYKWGYLGYTEQCVFLFFFGCSGVCHGVCRLPLAERGLYSWGSWASPVAVRGLSSPAACEILVP